MTSEKHNDLIISPDDVDRRIIEPDEFVADTSAFVDVRLEGSAGKASYSFIGPGVSQNADQVVNLIEPHGFCIGAASMPSGSVNNQHMHYTAEVFICTRGQWQMRLGQHGEERVDIGPNTVFSVPTWMFRGFQNISGDDSWMFSVLGGDDTGGLLWAPQVLEAAAQTGLYLTPDHRVVDAQAGDPTDQILSPVEASRLEELDSYTEDEIRGRIVGANRLDWSDSALLSAVVPGHSTAIAPVIGFGLTENRRQRPPIGNPHGFSVEWLRLEPGASTGVHRIERSQALVVVDGDLEIAYNRGADRACGTAPTSAVVSVPGGSWREFTNTGSSPTTCVVVCDGDERARIEWDPSVVTAAHDLGVAIDANGYRAPIDLLASMQ